MVAPLSKIIQKKVKYGTFNKPICITVFVRTIYCTVLPGSCYSISYLYPFISIYFWRLLWAQASMFRHLSVFCFFFVFVFVFLHGFYCIDFILYLTIFLLSSKVSTTHRPILFSPESQSPVWNCKARNKSNHCCVKTYWWTSVLGARRHTIRKEPLCNCWQHPQLGSVGL